MLFMVVYWVDYLFGKWHNFANLNEGINNMKISERTQKAGLIGMAGSLLFFVGLLIEYQNDLFPPGNGALFVINQIMFFSAMSGILFMIYSLRGSGALGEKRFGKISQGIFFGGWAFLIIGGILGLLTGEWDENLFFPIGSMLFLVGGLLTGIAVLTTRHWQGWRRLAPLGQAVYYIIVMMILPPLLWGTNEPTLLIESLWMLTWFLMSLAMYQSAE